MLATMDIALLAHHIEFLPALAEWYRDEWEPYYGVDGPGDALADLKSRCNEHRLPIGIVALEDDKVRGVAALDLDVATKLAPSVVGLLVAPEYRGQGVASLLLESAKSLAEGLGCSRVYISTTKLGDHLLKRGWRDFGSVKFLNEQKGSVYSYDLSGSTW